MSEYNNAAIRVIAALASDIRGSWGYGTFERCYEIMRLCRRIDRDDWADEVEEGLDDIAYDGRWFRNWDGPYGGVCSHKDLELVNVDLDLFDNPEDAVSDY